MPVDDKQWTAVAPSEFPWEQEALDFLRANLTAVVGAWSNFEFVAPGGNVYEVDLMVLTPTEVCVVEIKSWGGILEGNPNALQRRANESAIPYPVSNPLVLTNRKAKILAGLVGEQPSMRRVDRPYFRAVLFLSNPNLDLRIAPEDRSNIYHAREIIDGLRPNLKKLKNPKVKLDKARVSALGKAFRSLGIRRPNRTLRVGEWILDELLEDSDRYQDHLAHHVTVPESFRRVRTYTVPAKAPKQQQELARRAARREFQLTDSLHHPGILRPLEFVYHDYGPALVYFYDKEAVRLDQFLASGGQALGLEQRLDLVRQLADVLRYAHARRVYHRGLAPQSVLVLRPHSERPQLQVMNWQTGTEEGGTTGTSHIGELMDNAAKAYLAPEAVSQPATASGELVDVFSLGAVTYHILTGQPPADSHVHLYQKLSEHPGLRLSAVSDGPWKELEGLVELATRPQVTERPATVGEFLGLLDKAERDLLGSDEEQVDDPLEARPGDRLPGGFTVHRRLGKGGLALALEVIRDQQSYVLKVAQEKGHNERMRQEAAALAKLDHPNIVHLFGTEEMSGHTCLRLQQAGDKTLSQRLAERGPLQLELLERFGEDLLGAVVYLEKVGVHHRDIKPANLGVSLSTRDDALHLVLFDFSLAATPEENVGAGTPDYLDPFLKLEKPARWDLGAERYSAAVTLYEMATGTLPRWGDGQSDPGLDRKARLVLEAERFDPALREGMTDFFETALARVRSERFDNAQEMLAAWKAIFAEGAAGGVSETDTEALERRVQQAEPETTLASLGLGTRVLRALDHLGALTVGELLALPTRSLYTPAGVGASTRKEIVAVQEMLRERFSEDEVAPVARSEELGAGVLEPLLERVLGKQEDKDRKLREAYLGLLERGAKLVWPPLADLAGELGIEVQAVARSIPSLRRAWAKLSHLASVRGELHEFLTENGGLMTVEEASLALLSRRGALSNDPVRRQRMASAIVRAAVEAEQTEPEERFLWQRLGGTLMVARSQDHLRYAERLGAKAAELAGREPLPSPQRVQEELRQVAGPEETRVLTPHRLVRLAAGCSRTAAVSSREELYPRGMEAGRALILAHGALVGERTVKPREMRERVLSRYPESVPLPDRPELDGLVEEADPDLVWAPEEGAYRRQTLTSAGSSGTTLFRRFSTTSGSVAPGATPEIAEARRFEDRLQHACREDSFVVLMVEPQAVIRVEEELLRRFPDFVRRSLDRLFLEAMQKTAQSLGVDWDRVLTADARPGTADWNRLMSLVARAMPELEGELLGADTPQLLVHPGLLARYGQLGLIEKLRDAAGARDGIPAVWLLLAVEGQSELPMVEGEAIALLHSGQRARVPTAWLENRHRGAREEVLS